MVIYRDTILYIERLPGGSGFALVWPTPAQASVLVELHHGGSEWYETSCVRTYYKYKMTLSLIQHKTDLTEIERGIKNREATVTQT